MAVPSTAGDGARGAASPTEPPTPEVPSPVDSAIAEGRRLLGLRAIQYVASFVMGVLIARALSPSLRAEYALPLNLAGIGFVVFHLSIESALSRMAAQRRATYVELSRVGMTTAALVGGLGTLVCVMLGFALRGSALGGASPTAIVLAMATIGPTIANVVVVALLLRRGHTRLYGAGQVAQALLQLTLIVALDGLFHLSPEVVLVVNLALLLAVFTAYATALARDLGRIALVPALDPVLVRRVLGTGLALHGSAVASFLNLRLDLFLVGAMLSAHDAGTYSLSVTLADLCVVGTTTMSMAALRDQTELAPAEAVAYTWRFAARSLRYAVAFATIAAALCYPFISLAYGAAWRPAALPFAILAVGTIGLAVESPARGMLIRVGRRPVLITSVSCSALVVNVAANLALIPRLGTAGAALASVLSYWTAAGLAVLLLRHDTRGLDVSGALA